MNSKASSALLAVWLWGAFGQALFSAPVIVDFSPNAGAPGDQIQLTGTGFSSPNLTVRFWNGGSGVVAKIIYVNSDSVMSVAVPSGITNGPISIQQGGTSAFFTVQDFLAIGTGPFITAFFPVTGEVGDTVTITGVHFANPKAVLFHDTRAAECWANAAGTQISTRVPPGATTGPITVQTAKGSSNSPAAFTILGPEPYIEDFVPHSGAAGTKVQISGQHFTGAIRVTFNGQNGVNLATNSDTLIQAEAPAGVTTGPIGVHTAKGSNYTTAFFYAPPSISRFSPSAGRAQTNVSIAGNNLLGTTAVYFNGLLSSNFSVLNNSNLNASVPRGAATGLLRVVAPGGSTFSASNFVIRPTVSGFSPSSGPVGTPVTITGANLNAGAPSVRFNGVLAVAPTAVGFSQLTAKVPTGAATGPISVTTADGSDTNAALFYLPASLSSFSPTNSPPGSRVRISGQNLLGTTKVLFNGTPAASFAVSNNTTLGATVPAGVITGPISLSTPAGDVISTGLFYGSPVISSFNPVHGLPGTNVTISGVNFLGGTVLFNGLAASVNSLNNTQLVARVPEGAKTGPISIRGPAGTNTTAASFVLDYTSDLQVSITASANPVTVGSNLVYTIWLVNAGPAAAPKAAFTNVLPAGAVLRSAAISPPWILTTNRNRLIGTASSFAPAGSTLLSVVLVPQTVGNITNTISVQSDYSDPVPADNTAVISTTVEPLALLAISLQADHAKLSWSAALSNFVLQYRDPFNPGSHWAPVVTPPSVSANTRSVSEPTNGVSRLYRLHR